MSKIVVLDETYDLFLGYTWGFGSQGVSGHLYECIEYYHILKKHMKVGIFICTSELLTAEHIKAAVEDKYDFTPAEVDELLSDVHFFDPPKVFKGTNLLLVDGNFPKLKDTHILFKNIMAFACYNKAIAAMENITAFLDFRVYGECSHHKNYVKKILFYRYKHIDSDVSNVNLLYNKKGPRYIHEDVYKEVESKYNGDFLVVTDAPVDNLSDRFTLVNPPVQDLFKKFSTYIYTPIPKQFDCSPRFIAECEWYSKDVIYHNIDYWDIDKGLYWRKQDIENNFDSIILKEDDEIVDLVCNIING